MSETLYSEQLTNPDFLLWEREIQADLGVATLHASGIEYAYGGDGGSTGNFVDAYSFGGGGNTGNIVEELGGEGGGNTGNFIVPFSANLNVTSK